LGEDRRKCTTIGRTKKELGKEGVEWKVLSSSKLEAGGGRGIMRGATLDYLRKRRGKTEVSSLFRDNRGTRKGKAPLYEDRRRMSMKPYQDEFRLKEGAIRILRNGKNGGIVCVPGRKIRWASVPDHPRGTMNDLSKVIRKGGKRGIRFLVGVHWRIREGCRWGVINQQARIQLVSYWPAAEEQV